MPVRIVQGFWPSINVIFFPIPVGYTFQLDESRTRFVSQALSTTVSVLGVFKWHFIYCPTYTLIQVPLRASMFI